jgi:hypothetical protein
MPSQPDALFECRDQLSVEETAQHTVKPICSEATSSCTSAPHLPIETVDQPPQICSIKERSRNSLCDALDERPNCQKRADTPCHRSTDDTMASSLSFYTAGEMQNPYNCIVTSRLPFVSGAPPLVVTTASNKPMPPSDLPTNAQTSRTAETSENPTSTHDSQSLLLACVSASVPLPSTAHSTEPMSPASPAKHIPGVMPSVPLPESPLREPPLASQDALAVVGRKRKHQDNNVVGLGRRNDLELVRIAAKISDAILLGGLKYRPSTFETWERDLWLLNPDRAKLTLAGLLTHQRAHTEALLCQGIVARIIHSWCLIAQECRLSTVDRSKVTRRDQKEIRLSLRCRKLGILFLEIINKLSAQPDIGTNAYKVCPAIAGKRNS